MEVASDSLARPAETILRRLFRFKKNARRGKFSIGSDLDFFIVQMKVLQCLSFIHAHQRARQVFKEEFSKAGNENVLTPAEKIVLDEWCVVTLDYPLSLFLVLNQSYIVVRSSWQ